MTESEGIPAKLARRAPLWQVITIGHNPWLTLVRAAVMALVCVLVAKYIVLPVRVEGVSMWPTYRDRSVNFINCLAYLRHEPRRGDVVGIRLTPPAPFYRPHVMYLKRIIGLPGETLAFIHGKVYIDGKILSEPYEHLHCNWYYGPITLRSNEYFFVGDNRTMPEEDHVFGRAPRNKIVGKILF